MVLLELSYKTPTIGQHKIPYNNNRLDATTNSCPWQSKKAQSISEQSYKFKQELNIHQNEKYNRNTSTKQARNIKKTPKTEGLKQILE